MSIAHGAWEHDFGELLEDVDWAVVLSLVRAMSCNHRFKLLHFNFVHRTYITPVRLNKIDPARGASCPKCGLLDASFLHLARSCQMVYQFWRAVVGKVEEVMGLRLKVSPVTCLLGVVKRPRGRNIPYKRTQLALVLAKRRVAIGWMISRCPSISCWISDLMEWGAAEEQHLCITRRGKGGLTDVVAWGTLLVHFSSVEELRFRGEHG
ncbi:hypothetical protein NDU88_000736 [Pleurodeles waltl]|uniref:Reverse transcriptase n=1 Tax=Pleurodeles waltl TaxID=8319 RepID=A0AAV7VY62_PLEWA|nr:hypothetical protein NDU88_000736 [Pleurodeles waltl]